MKPPKQDVAELEARGWLRKLAWEGQIDALKAIAVSAFVTLLVEESLKSGENEFVLILVFLLTYVLSHECFYSLRKKQWQRSRNDS